MSSKDIKEELCAVFGGAAKDWKRVAKFTNEQGETERQFENAALDLTCSAIDRGGETILHAQEIRKDVATASAYCFAVQLYNDGALENENAHCIIVMPLAEWQQTQDNDWGPTEAEERMLGALMPRDAENQGFNASQWTWSGMTTPAVSALAMTQRGFTFVKDFQDYCDSELTQVIEQRLSKGAGAPKRQP